MTKLNGIYTYNIPDRITKGIDGLTLSPTTEDPEDYRNRAGAEDVNFLIVRQGIVNDILQYYPNVQWLQLLNAGFEKVDLDLLRRRNIMFTNARSVYCATIAEDVIAKILLLARNYTRHFNDQRKNFWPTDDQLPNFNLDLSGRVLGILGAGAIGHEIAIRARVFGLHVCAYDPYLKERDGFEVIYGGEDGLETLLRESDFVVTSLPVTEQTKDIMNAKTFAMMKPSAFLINVARGQIIDEQALIHALNTEAIRGAAIDVAKEEPLSAGNPLWSAKNLMITPHRAAYGDQMGNKMCALIEKNIHHYLNGEPLEDRIL